MFHTQTRIQRLIPVRTLLPAVLLAWSPALMGAERIEFINGDPAPIKIVKPEQMKRMANWQRHRTASQRSAHAPSEPREYVLNPGQKAVIELSDVSPIYLLEVFSNDDNRKVMCSFDRYGHQPRLLDEHRLANLTQDDNQFRFSWSDSNKPDQPMILAPAPEPGLSLEPPTDDESRFPSPAQDHLAPQQPTPTGSRRRQRPDNPRRWRPGLPALTEPEVEASDEGYIDPQWNRAFWEARQALNPAPTVQQPGGKLPPAPAEAAATRFQRGSLRTLKKQARKRWARTNRSKQGPVAEPSPRQDQPVTIHATEEVFAMYGF
jgi:hypothetical protein